MTPELYQRAGDLFHRLRVLAKQDRESALDLACSGDNALRSEVLALLEADEEAADSFLQASALDGAANLPLNPSPVPESRIPAVIAERYRILAPIGAGGMGIVFHAEDLRLSRPVAIKILNQAARQDDERYLRFQREARAASQLNHPHITAIYDAGVDNGLAYIAMELVEGKTLRQIIAEEPAPNAETIIRIIRQVASALNAAHKAGIVHRDIKPENIIVRPDGLLKVLDFGLARIRLPQSDPRNPVTLLTRPGQLAGTVQYLSPEQVLGQTTGPQSDVFSVGVVAYELATGVRPFDGPTDGAIFDAILHHQPRRPSQLRPDLGTRLDAIIRAALEKKTDARTATAEQLELQCERFNIPRRFALPSPTRRRFLMAAIAILAVALGTWWFLRMLPEPRATRTFQITNNGPVHEFATDGSRVFYSAGMLGPDSQVYQVNADGGEPVVVPRFKGMMPLDISPDGSQMLLKDVSGGANGIGPLWQASLNDSGMRRMGDIDARYARWSARGDRIVYSLTREVRTANSDGSGSRLVFSHHVGDPESPYFLDGDRRIRFSLLSHNANRLFEIEANGGGLRQSLPEWEGGLQSFPTGSSKGFYCAFIASHNNHDWDLWMFQEHARRLPFGSPRPVRLTQGPLVVRRPQFSPNGRRIFFVGDAGHAELVQLDSKSGQWTPYLGGIDAFQLDISRDKQWVTFVGPPGLSVWRRKADGSNPEQLTRPPLNAVNPRWSPDRSKIVFFGGKFGQPSGIFMIDVASATVTPLLTRGAAARFEGEPSWSPDGKRILYSVDYTLEVIDLSNRVVEKLPNSDGLSAPRWSPNGRYAVSNDTKAHLILYDMATHQRTLLSTIGSGYPSWSLDGRYVYFLNGPCSILYQVEIHTREVNPIASLDGLRLASHGLGWVAVSPEGSVISARDVGTRNIYALDLQLP